MFDAKKQQGGFTIIELIIVMSAVIVILAMFSQFIFREIERAKAKRLGHEIAQYNVAVRKALVHLGNAWVGNYNGVNWLKAVACGGTAPEPYLPCGFPNQTVYGLPFQTTVVQDAAGYVVATTRLGPINDGIVRKDLMGLAALTATSRDTVKSTSNGFESYDVDQATGELVAVAATASDLDIWLRRDGSNQMMGILDMNGNSILNANNVGAVNVTALQNVVALQDVQANRDILANRDVIIARDLRVMGQGVFNNNISVQRDVVAQGNLEGQDTYIRGRNRWASQGVYDMGVYSHGAIIPQPQCPQGKTPQVFAEPIVLSRGPVAEPISVLQTFVSTVAGGWQLNIKLLTTSGWINPPSGYAMATVTVKCI